MLPTLQSGFCTTGKSPAEYFRDFEFLEAVACTYIDVTGLLFFGMLVYGAVGLSIYIRTGSIVIPVILLLVAGGAILPFVAAPATAAATVAVLFAGGGVIAYLYYRYSR